MTAAKIQANTPTLTQQVVTIYSRQVASTGLLLRYEPLDGDGKKNLSVTGCKSCIPGRRTGDTLLVRLPNGTVLPAKITHIHEIHDRFRAEVEARLVSAAGLDTVASIDAAASRTGESVTYLDALQQSYLS